MCTGSKVQCCQACQASPIAGNTNWTGVLSGQAVSPLAELDPAALPPASRSKAGDYHARRVKICRLESRNLPNCPLYRDYCLPTEAHSTVASQTMHSVHWGRLRHKS
jgi:hypothetical protein